MGNVCFCGHAAASSSSDTDAQYQQLLQDLKANADISLDNLDTLLDAMEVIFSKLKDPNEASSSSFSEGVTQSATVGRNIVNTLSTHIQSQLTPTIPKCTCIGHGQMSANKMKDLVTKALDSRTMKLVGDVLEKTQKIPYIGAAASMVVYLLEQYDRSSSNAKESMELLEHLFALVKCMKDVGPDDNADQMFHDMLCFIVKSTLSLAQQMNRSSIKRFAFAYPDSKDLQSMRNALMLKYQHTQLRALMDIYKNVPRLPQAPSKVYFGIEGAMEEVKKKLNMIDESKKFVVIWGLGGIGKTTLGDHVYNSVVDKSKYSHCKLEMDIKSTDVPKLQFQLLNQVFQETKAVLNAGDGQGRIAKAIDKSSNQSKPLFLYIDNAIIKGDVESLLPAKSLSSLPQRSRIMVTTRNLKEVATWRGIPGFEVEEFKMEETREGKKMLSYYALGDENGSFDQDVDVDQLLDMCMGVPLIIQMAAKKLRDLNTRRDMDMSEACENVIEHMQSLRKGEGWENDDMDRMVDFVYGQLPKSFQRIFLDIVFFFINWRRYKVVCIFGEIVIGELEDSALLSTNEEGRLKIHDIIKVRAHAISDGSRICDRDSWELVKRHPEVHLQKFNAIEGLHIDVEEDDMEYVSRCDKVKILILRKKESEEPLKVHFPSSVEILCLKGYFVHNENLVNAFKVVKMKMNEFQQGFTSYQSFRQVKCLDLVQCKGVDISACFSHAPSSCRRLRLSGAELEIIPSGNKKVYYQLESLKLDTCYNLRYLPDIFIQHCSSIKILSLEGCVTLKTLPPSFGLLKKLEKLVLYGCKSMETLCENFGSLSKLKELDISFCGRLQVLPPSFGLLKNLEKLDMWGCASLRSFCENFGSLSNLIWLSIRTCKTLQALPHSFGQLKNLEKLEMSGCTSLKSLCENFGSLSKLKELTMRSCESIETLPPSFGLLENLEKLNMGRCRSLESLCENIGSLSKLKELTMRSCESIETLPPSFGLLKKLEKLDMWGCTSLKSLCENFGSLSELKELTMRSCESIETLPSSFGLLENLEKLNMGKCRSLESLCENFGSLSNLEELDINNCHSFQALPPSFGLLKNLKKLDIRSCKSLESLCEKFGSLSKLEELKIENCQTLQALPPSFGLLENLETLDIIKGKSLKSLCENFGSLSKLKKLKIENCQRLQALPPSFGLLENLETLDIRDCKSLKTVCENFGSLSKLKYLSIRDCGSLQALPHSFGLLQNLERLTIFGCGMLKSLGGNSNKLQAVRQLRFCDSLKVIDLYGCTMLEDLLEGLNDMHALRRLDISHCKNIKISADNLPPVHVLRAAEIDAVDEKMVDDLLRLPTVLDLTISDNFEKHIESYAWKYTPLPLISLVINDRVHFNVLRKLIVECLLYGGRGGEYWRMEGDDNLVREEAQPENNNVALIITGLNPVSRRCREAVHQMVKEGYEITYVDTGISRWKRYENTYQRQGRAFSGEVALNQDDMQMMKRTLKELQLPNECVPRVWTSPFPKSCLTLAFHLYLDYICEYNLIRETLVLKRCSLGEAASTGRRFSTTIESDEPYDKERSCEFGDVALPSLGIQNISSEGLACFAASWRARTR